jgi:hypothetical protein
MSVIDRCIVAICMTDSTAQGVPRKNSKFSLPGLASLAPCRSNVWSGVELRQWDGLASFDALHEPSEAPTDGAECPAHDEGQKQIERRA